MLKTLESNTVLNKIIDSIKELKGMDIVLLDLRKIENAICKFFVKQLKIKLKEISKKNTMKIH